MGISGFSNVILILLVTIDGTIEKMLIIDRPLKKREKNWKKIPTGIELATSHAV